MLTDELLSARLGRLCSVMAEHDVPFLLTADPINIYYATGARNMTVPSELDLMLTAVDRVQAGVTSMIDGIEPGRSEIEIWSEFHRHLIATEGEYVVARLVQSGERTFPYFQEAGTRTLACGDLFGIDTDATGFGGYAVDFSRTFVCGGKQPSPEHIGDPDHRQGIKLEDQFVITDDGSRRMTTLSLELTE